MWKGKVAPDCNVIDTKSNRETEASKEVQIGNSIHEKEIRCGERMDFTWWVGTRDVSQILSRYISFAGQQLQ